MLLAVPMPFIGQGASPTLQPFAVGGHAGPPRLWGESGPPCRLTAVLLVAYIAMGAFIQTPSPSQAEVIRALQPGWQVGFSAVIGRIGGKAI